ncbi:hypothetical protein MYK68_18630 [Gordonia sp. PP30]|uniref:hypothetical protein n=1 Tax=Gordonia sp. PP30 TaxID=2935861 RepID=UPI001FFE5B76|nr:hypothetical protein [Gordonia sp. PP30]UQE74701.1 hypothetical protein MYK68_18630 [Gordonia sp. PP30]
MSNPIRTLTAVPCPSKVVCLTHPLAQVQPATITDLLDLAVLLDEPSPVRLVELPGIGPGMSSPCPFAADDTSAAALAFRARLPLAARVEAVRAAVPPVTDVQAAEFAALIGGAR